MIVRVAENKARMPVESDHHSLAATLASQLPEPSQDKLVAAMHSVKHAYSAYRIAESKRKPVVWIRYIKYSKFVHSYKKVTPNNAKKYVAWAKYDPSQISKTKSSPPNANLKHSHVTPTLSPNMEKT